jgi:hypothetical protein
MGHGLIAFLRRAAVVSVCQTPPRFAAVLPLAVGILSGIACAKHADGPRVDPVAKPTTPEQAAVQSRTANDRDLEARQADLVITTLAAQTSVSLKVGQTIGILPPSATTTYQVDFASSHLRLLTPPESVGQPGARGWVWRAIASGELDLLVTGRAACPKPPCGENLERYTLTIRIGPAAKANATRTGRHEDAESGGDGRGADQPDEALRWRQIFERDEFGNIDPDGLMKARRQVQALRQRRTGTEQLSSTVAADAAGLSAGAWSWIGPGNIGGRTRALIVHPTITSTIFAGSVGGGIWKTTNGGATWNPVDDFMANLAVSSMLFHPIDPSIMYAGTGEGFFNIDSLRGAGVFKSIDGGSTWAQLPATAPTAGFLDFAFVNELAISPDGTTLLAATGTGLYRSLDGGNIWTRTLSVSPMQDVKFIPGSNVRVVAGGRTKNAYYSTNGGASWTGTNIPTGGSNKRVELGVSVSNPNVVYASIAEGGGSSTPPAELWKSVDHGASYTLVFNQAPSLLGTQGWYDNAVWVDPTNVNHLLVAGQSVFRSIDGGATFGAAFSGGHADYHVFTSDPGFNGTTNRRVYIANDGGVYKWEDVSVTTTTKLNNNFGVTQFYGADGLTSNGKIFGGTQDNGTLLYQPASGAQAWSPIFGGDGGYATADRVNNYLYGELQYLGVHRSANGATSALITGCSKPAPYRLDDGCGTTANFIAPIRLDPNNPDRLLAGGMELWRTDDPRTVNTATTGPSWAAIKPSIASPISAIEVAKNNSNLVWIGHNNGDVYLTMDGTSSTPSWLQRDLSAPGLPNRAVTSIAVDPLDASTVFVAFGGYTSGNLWVTHNNGATWADAAGAPGSRLPDVPIRWVVRHPTAPGWVYVATDVGVFASLDGGGTWSLPHDGPANVAVFQLFFMGTTLVAVTHGRGLFTVDVPDPQAPPAISTHPQSQVIGSGQTATLSVVAQGAAPLTYQWYQGASPDTATPVAGATSSSFTTPALTVNASYWVRVSNPLGVADSNTATITVGPPFAVHSQTLEAPRCVGVSSECDSGPTLLLGRDTMAGGAEPNQPNTINNSCTDGSQGSFHVDESIDRIKVSTVDGTPFAPGKVVRIDVNVWAFGTQDQLDLYYTSNASSPAWTFVASLFPAGAGARFLTTTYVLPAGALQAVRAVFKFGLAAANSCVAGPYNDHDDLVFAVGGTGPELLQNGNFSSGLSNWQLYDGANVVHNGGAGGEFLYHRNPIVTGTGQAVIFQETGAAAASGTALTVQFDVGNLDTVRKRISVLIADSDFSDLAVCTFFLAAGAPMRTYSMNTHTTRNWMNAAVYFYTASDGVGDYRLDNVSLRTNGGASTARTDCVDPTVPLAPGGAAGPDLLTNGSFASGLAPWSPFFDITYQIANGVFEFVRPGTPGQSAGGIMQSVGQPMSAGQILTATFQLGNNSTVRKRVTVLIHDDDFSDLTACTFWLAPGQLLSDYAMRTVTTKAWANATVSVYAATIGSEPWTRLDNVTLQRTSGVAVVGTECIEPAEPSPAPAPSPFPPPDPPQPISPAQRSTLLPRRP